MGQRRLSEEAASYRRGYLVVWVGLIFVLATVNIWGAVAVMVMAYVGAGAWFYTGDAGEAPEHGAGHRSGDRPRSPAAGLLPQLAGGDGLAAARAERRLGERPPCRVRERSHTNRTGQPNDDRDIPQAPGPARPRANAAASTCSSAS